VPYSIQIPLELQKAIERVTAAAEKRDMTFELNASLVRLMRTEVTRAENALGLGAHGARTRKSAGEQAPAEQSQQTQAAPAENPGL
jgi:hypothetical protein